MTNKASFEEVLTELEETVLKLETGGLTLEESLALFERGQVLASQCEAVLKDVDLRLEQLRTAADGFEPVPFDEED